MFCGRRPPTTEPNYPLRSRHLPVGRSTACRMGWRGLLRFTALPGFGRPPAEPSERFTTRFGRAARRGLGRVVVVCGYDSFWGGAWSHGFLWFRWSGKLIESASRRSWQAILSVPFKVDSFRSRAAQRDARSNFSISFFSDPATRCFARYTLAMLMPRVQATFRTGQFLITYKSKI